MSIFSWSAWRQPLSCSRSSNPSRRTPKRRRLARRLELEQLEDRIVPSVPPVAHPPFLIYMPPGQPYQSPGPVGYTPSQIQTAYGINQLYGTVGDGAGQTIAIVDAYDAPNFVDSTSPAFDSSDLHKFDVQFGLPDPPRFLKLNQNGGTTLPGTDPAGPPNDWEAEESLDVEWAHAIAPGANIILFEANSASFSDLNAAVAAAAHYPGVSVVSMSFGGAETSSDPSQNSVYTTPPGHQGVTFLASTGDSGSPGGYPAYSPNVIGVGGTSLTLNANNSYNSETGWSGSGGGTSKYEPEPAYQRAVQNTGKRTIPDVAFDADPATGVTVYDSYDNGSAKPWIQIGGTSLAAPSWAGLIALADQGLVQRGETTLNGPTQALPDLYNLFLKKPGDFHDITSGSNGAFTAGPGYDEVTGLGSPVANRLIPDLIGIEVNNTLAGATEGQALTNAAVATFNDPTGSQPVTDYTATITWGDGAVAYGTVVANGGNRYTVLGSHTYINAGNYTLTVAVQNNRYDLAGISSTPLPVADAPLTPSAQEVNGASGAVVSNALVAIFTDSDSTPRPASHYTATVEWNEGNGLVVADTGTVEHMFGNTFAVFANSPYTLPSGGLFPLQVVVRDVNGGSVVVGSVLNVANNPAIPPLLPDYQSDSGPFSSRLVAVEDALANLLQAERLFLFAFQFGTMAERQGSFGNLVNAFLAYEAAIVQFDIRLPGA